MIVSVNSMPRQVGVVRHTNKELAETGLRLSRANELDDARQEIVELVKGELGRSASTFAAAIAECKERVTEQERRKPGNVVAVSLPDTHPAIAPVKADLMAQHVELLTWTKTQFENNFGAAPPPPPVEARPGRPVISEADWDEPARLTAQINRIVEHWLKSQYQPTQLRQVKNDLERYFGCEPPPVQKAIGNIVRKTPIWGSARPHEDQAGPHEEAA